MRKNCIKYDKYSRIPQQFFLVSIVLFLLFAGYIVKSEDGALNAENDIIINTEDLKEIDTEGKEDNLNEVENEQRQEHEQEAITEETSEIEEEKVFCPDDIIDVPSSTNERLGTKPMEVDKSGNQAQKKEINESLGQVDLSKGKEKETGKEDVVESKLVENKARVIPKIEIQLLPTDTAKQSNFQGIVFSEVVIGDEKSSKNEFIELYNSSNKVIDLESFSLKKKTKSGSKSTLVSSAKFFGSIGPEEFFVIKNVTCDAGIEADLTFSGKSYSLAKDNRVYLEDSDGNLLDAIGWGDCEGDCEREMIFAELRDGQSLSRKEFKNPRSFLASEFEVTNIVTPGEKNVFSSEFEYPKNIVFSEILSNPEGIDKNAEWVELENRGNKKANLSGWVIENGSGKRFKLDNFEIGQGQLRVVYITNSSFTIRNSNEKLSLINPAEKLVNRILIPGSALSGVSFGWTLERGWSWNRKQTPGIKNVANSLPKIKIKKQKNIYKKTYAIFDAKKSKDRDKDELKFVWDFGDGHKSYLETTKHSYEKNGKYNASLFVKDGFEVVKKDFKVEVKSYPKRKLRLTQLLPNPKGVDKGSEMIEIENLSSKKINLIDFYIATGHKNSSVVRHKILEDFVLKAHEKKFITNEKVCLFSLLNTDGRVELLYPDGKSAFEVEYEKDKIGEGDIFQLSDKKWSWLVFETPKKPKPLVLGEANDIFQNQEADGRNKEIRAILNIITLNDDLKICETYIKMQIENWKNIQENPLLSFRKRVAVSQKFSWEESF